MLACPGAPALAGGAAKALRPARGGEVFEAGGVVREAFLEVHDAAREVWPAHKTTLGAAPDGTG
jgi:hypothetical protein